MLVEKAKILKYIKIRLGVVAAQIQVRTVRGAQYTQDHHLQPVQGVGSFLQIPGINSPTNRVSYQQDFVPFS